MNTPIKRQKEILGKFEALKKSERKDGDLNAYQKATIEKAATLQKAVHKLEDLKAELSWHQEMAKRIKNSSIKEVESILQQAQDEYNTAVEANIRSNKTQRDLQNIRDRREGVSK